MARLFDPRKVLRQVSNALLREFFRRRQELEAVPWESLAEQQIEPVYEAWQQLPEAQRRDIQVIFQDVNELSEERGLRVLAEEISVRCPERMSDFAAIEGRCDKAMWVFLNVPQAFEDAAMFSRAEGLATGRYWIKRNSLPKHPIAVTRELKKRLGEALVGYYAPSQGRGHWCHIEHYSRANGAEYFFAYLDDYPDHHLVFDEGGQMQRHPERGAFDNVFVFTPTDGTLELFARGGKKVHEPLQELFCQSALGVEVDPATPIKPAYTLDGLKDEHFPFPTDPHDHIAEVRVRRLRLEIINSPRRKITLDADPNGHKNDIYQMMERYLNGENLPLSKVRITLATFRLTFMSDGGKPKTLTFDVCHPNSCDLKSKPDGMRAIGERCLKMWGITND